jgi:hypothetical protein
LPQAFRKPRRRLGVNQKLLPDDINYYHQTLSFLVKATATAPIMISDIYRHTLANFFQTVATKGVF